MITIIGSCCLLLAVNRNDAQCCKALLAGFADPCEEAKDGLSVLEYTLRRNRQELHGMMQAYLEASNLLKPFDFLPGFFSYSRPYAVRQYCYTYAHGFVRISYREPFGEKATKRRTWRRRASIWTRCRPTRPTRRSLLRPADGIRNPRTQAQKWSKLVPPIEFTEYYIFRNWSSGALVGGRGFRSLRSKAPTLSYNIIYYKTLYCTIL